MNSDSPTDPISDLVASSVQLHEMYESFIHAGFNEQQAMTMICALITAGINGQPC
jgi:hypothetical protein